MKGSAKQAGEGQSRNRVWTRPWIKFSLASPAGFMLTMLLAAVALGGGVIMRVSTDSVGVQAYAYSNSDTHSISADGRYLAFRSDASNLVPGDTNGTDEDIFLKDTLTGATTRVSTDAGGAQGNEWSGNPSVSADGRFVGFHSYASNLVLGDTNSARDVFLAGAAFTCTAGEPDLALQKTDIFWGSYADYTARLLSIDLKVKNNGTDAAYIVQVTGTTNTNGVACAVCTSSLGNLTAGSEHSFTLKYNIPNGVTSFSTTLAAPGHRNHFTGILLTT